MIAAAGLATREHAVSPHKALRISLSEDLAQQLLGNRPGLLQSLTFKAVVCVTGQCSAPSDDRNWTSTAGQQLTALQIAIEYGHATMGRLLYEAALDAGADVTSLTQSGIQMLHKAASK